MNIEVAFVMWLVAVMFAGANMTLVQELEATAVAQIQCGDGHDGRPA